MSSPGDFYHDSVRKARKVYTCAECEGQIPKGAQYQRLVDKYEYEFYTIRLCMICAADWKTVMEFGLAETMDFGCIPDDVEEAVNIGVIDLSHPLVAKYCPELIEQEAARVLEEQSRPKPVPWSGDPVVIPFGKPDPPTPPLPPQPRKPA